MTRRQAGRTGFTLVELLVVIVVMSILVGLSVAGYSQHVRRANRVDATASLLRIAAAQERFYLQNNRYATALDELAAAPPAGLGIGATERDLYALALSPDPAGAAVGYRATATARVGLSQSRDRDCQTLSIDQSGHRGATAADGRSDGALVDRCWR